ncbi:DUF2158 domain-containing protein [Paraburkholderia sp. J10-1]|uniref:DUF2158 domain-containing protein n=2 Tax=unclassified Paraburkholderia TaxID=2615204 RepID=UPI002AB6F409|nr:DUF2158 domain-containing protein [Paraburkholderia sp. J10-1]
MANLFRQEGEIFIFSARALGRRYAFQTLSRAGGASPTSRENPGGDMSAVCAIHSDSRSGTLSSVAERYKGRTVRLCSGGPLMTVNQVVPTAYGPQLSCAWFDPPGSTKLVRAVFSTEAVQFASA